VVKDLHMNIKKINIKGVDSKRFDFLGKEEKEITGWEEW